MKRSLTKTVSLLLIVTFFADACCYGLATLPASQNPIAKREILAALQRTQIRYAESEDAVRLIGANKAECLLLSSGKYLVSKEVAMDDIKLLMGIIHEDIEAIMQILAQEDRSKYQGIKELILNYFPPDDSNGLPIDLYVNHTVAKAFEWLILKEQGIVLSGEIPQESIGFINAIEPIIRSGKHYYFTSEFWDSNERGRRIRLALNNGMRFYLTALPERGEANEPVAGYDDISYEECVRNIKGVFEKEPIAEKGEYVGKVMKLVAKIKDKRKALVLAIDGNSGAFKTTEAQRIALAIRDAGGKAVVIERDWFIDSRTARYGRQDAKLEHDEISLEDDEISLKTEKFEKEVLERIRLFNEGVASALTLAWDMELYDKEGGGALTKTVNIEVDRDTVVIIEGNYLLKKKWNNYFDVKLLMIVKPSIGLGRRRGRDESAGSRPPGQVFWRINTPSFINYMRYDMVKPDIIAVTDTWSEVPEGSVSGIKSFPARQDKVAALDPQAVVWSEDDYRSRPVPADENKFDVEPATVLLSDLLFSQLHEERTYEIKYDTSRLTVSQIGIIEEYAKLLQLRASNPHSVKVRPFSSAQGSKESLIAVYCTGKNFKGEGHVDVTITEGELEDYLLRVAGMLNIALASSNIPDDLLKEDVDKYRPVLAFIRNQYRDILGIELAMPNSPEDILKVIRRIVLDLPRSMRMNTDQIQEFDKLAKQALTSA